MEQIAFVPWIGGNYATSGLNGLRVMLLGESHYGERHYARRAITPETVRWLAQTDRQAFFTTSAKAVLGLGRHVHLPNDARAGFWEKVCFYNFVQELQPDARHRPSKEAWAKAAATLNMVVEAVKPDVVIVLGKALQARVLPLPQNIVVIRVNHPSSGFRYARWIPVIAEGLKAAREAKLFNAVPEERPSGPQFEDWLGISSRATKPTPAQLRTGNWCDSPRP